MPKRSEYLALALEHIYGIAVKTEVHLHTHVQHIISASEGFRDKPHKLVEERRGERCFADASRSRKYQDLCD